MVFFNNRKDLTCFNQFFLSKTRLKKWKFKNDDFTRIRTELSGVNYFFIPFLEKEINLDDLDIKDYNNLFKTSAVFKDIVYFQKLLILNSEKSFDFLELIWFLFLKNLHNYYRLFSILV